MRPLLNRLLITAILLLAPALGHAGEDAGMAQIGGGYRMTVACAGATATLHRVDEDQVFVVCSDEQTRNNPTVAAGTPDRLSLEPGDSVLLYCTGDRLKAKKSGGKKVTAFCRPLPAAVI